MERLQINEGIIEVQRGIDLCVWRCTRLENGMNLCHITGHCIK